MAKSSESLSNVVKDVLLDLGPQICLLMKPTLERPFLVAAAVIFIFVFGSNRKCSCHQ